jgi:hypothetical protein
MGTIDQKRRILGSDNELEHFDMNKGERKNALKTAEHQDARLCLG